MNDLLAKNLAFLLKGDKKAQAQIAEKVGVSQGTVSKWANLYAKGSNSEPEFRSMARLAECLNVSLADLASRDLEIEGPSHPLLPHQSLSQPVRLDTSRLALLIECMEGALRDSGRALDPARKARIIALMYADAGIQNTRDAVEAAMRGAFMTME